MTPIRVFAISTFCTIALAVLVAAASFAALPQWMEPGVRVGANRLDKSVFLNVYSVGLVTDIERGEIRVAGKVELGVAGEYGAGFFDESGKLDDVLNFAVQTPKGFKVAARIVKRTATRDLLFFRQAGPAAAYDSLVDHDGKEIWRTTQPLTASTMGDLSGGSTPEFVFGSQDGSTEARNIDDKIIWSKANVGWANKLTIVSPDHTEAEVYEAVNDGTLVRMSAVGEILSKQRPAIDGFFSGFSAVRWEGVCATPCLLVSRNERFQLLSTDGQHPVALLGPAHYVYNAHAIQVRLFKGAAPVLAVAGLMQYKGGLLAGFQAVYGALFVFDSQWNLVYHEVLPEEVDALCAVPAGSGKEALLVGAEGKVWKYLAK